MKMQTAETQVSETHDPLVGIKAKTGPYLGARSWSGGRRRVLGTRPREHCYHVMSRTCGGAVFFDDVEKEALMRLLWKMSEFCGLKLLTYCVMGNHFHALVEVPVREEWLRQFEGPRGEKRLFEHLAQLYSRAFLDDLRAEIAELREAKHEKAAQERLAEFTRRLCDLSIFVKEVKERFSRWYNKRHERKGTLWMDRFKSVLVEGGRKDDAPDALRTMAAYIDLNPVRAKLVTDPAKYRWSGYGEASGGSRRARRSLCAVTGVGVDAWEKRGAAAYRMWLYADGGEVTDKRQPGKIIRHGVSKTERRKVLAESGRLTRAQLIRLRVRYFTDGTVIGSKAYVEEVFASARKQFSPKRKNGPRLIRSLADEEALYSLRDLQVRQHA
jgi:REP element-mobilizing transposase RayT